MQDISRMSVSSLAEAMEQRQLTSLEITRAIISEIDENQGAYVIVTTERALEAATRADACRAQGKTGSLCGIPAAYSDNLCTKGVKTTCASKMLEQYVPPFDATVAEQMDAAGVVPLGKTKLDEFGMGSGTCGAAQAVANGQAAFALASDTSGSLLQPAARWGVVAMRPTYGAVSRYGLVACASSMDQVGPIARTVRDTATVLDALCGYDPKDATSVRRPYGGYAQGIGEGVSGMVFALPEELFGEGISADAHAAVEEAVRLYEKLGATVRRVSIPELAFAPPACFVIESAEASSNLARFDGVRYGHRAAAYGSLDELYELSRGEGFGEEVKRRILLGTFMLSAGQIERYYRQALKARTLVSQALGRVLSDCDAILSPAELCAAPASLAGLPALTMPIGLVLIGRAFEEKTLLRAGFALEREVR